MKKKTSAAGCELFRDLASAGLDGELTSREEAQLDAHLDSCPSCREHLATVSALGRTVRVALAEPVPDQTTVILSRTRHARRADGRARRALLERLGVGALGVVQVLFAWFDTVTGHRDEFFHAQRHVGAWGFAFGLALLATAVQPNRARGLLPMGTGLAAMAVATSVMDLHAGHGPALLEPRHVLDVLSLALLFLVAHNPESPLWQSRSRFRRPDGALRLPTLRPRRHHRPAAGSVPSARAA